MQNELGILEFIHAFVETLDKYFENVWCVLLSRGTSMSRARGGMGIFRRLISPSPATRHATRLHTPSSCSELDIMFNIEKAHFILEEMVTNGQIVTTNKNEVLKPILLLEKLAGGK